MRIESGTQSIQMLKAQQAWEARRSAKTAPAAEQVQTASPAIEIAKPALDSTPATGQTLSPQWSRKVQDIQQMAQKTGFMGVSEQDIRRAYTQGESLFADYRV